MGKPVRMRCIQDCFDGPRAIRYFPSVHQDVMIDPDDPIAKYFERIPVMVEVEPEEDPEDLDDD